MSRPGNGWPAPLRSLGSKRSKPSGSRASLGWSSGPGSICGRDCDPRQRALAGRAASRPVWIGASGLRLGLVGGLVGLAVTQTGVGLPGLLLSLTLVPVAVILTGLRAARAV